MSLSQAVMTRFTALSAGVHNNLYIALGGQLYNTVIPPGKNPPVAAFVIDTSDRDPTFTSDVDDTEISFFIFDGNTVKDGSIKSPSVIEGLFDKLVALYDRYQLTVTGFTLFRMYRTAWKLEYLSEEEMWRYSIEYQLKIHKTR